MRGAEGRRGAVGRTTEAWEPGGLEDAACLAAGVGLGDGVSDTGVDAALIEVLGEVDRG